MIEVTRELPSNIIWDNSYIVDENMYPGTILDTRITSEGGCIYLPTSLYNKEKNIHFRRNDRIDIPRIISVPCIIDIASSSIAYINPIQRYLNALVKAINSYKEKKSENKKEWMINIILGIRSSLVQFLESKSGYIRSTFLRLPMPYSLRGVATPDIMLDPNEVKIPHKVARAWIANPRFREEFNIPLDIDNNQAKELLIGQRIIIGRQPTHTLSNMMAFKIGGFTSYSISIHPGIISMMHGDFDGDTLWGAIESDIPESLYIENLVPRFYEPDKEYKIYGKDFISTYDELLESIGITLDEMDSGFSINPFEEESYPNYINEEYANGITDDTYLEADGALSYKILKRDTAIAGGIAGTLVDLAIACRNDLIVDTTIFRHTLAQNALDCKHGIKQYLGTSTLTAFQDMLYTSRSRFKLNTIIDTIETNKTVASSVKELIRHIEGYKAKDILEYFMPHYTSSKSDGKLVNVPQIKNILMNQFLSKES